MSDKRDGKQRTGQGDHRGYGAWKGKLWYHFAPGCPGHSAKAIPKCRTSTRAGQGKHHGKRKRGKRQKQQRLFATLEFVRTVAKSDYGSLTALRDSLRHKEDFVKWDRDRHFEFKNYERDLGELIKKRWRTFVNNVLSRPSAKISGTMKGSGMGGN